MEISFHFLCVLFVVGDSFVPLNLLDCLVYASYENIGNMYWHDATKIQEYLNDLFFQFVILTGVFFFTYLLV